MTVIQSLWTYLDTFSGQKERGQKAQNKYLNPILSQKEDEGNMDRFDTKGDPQDERPVAHCEACNLEFYPGDNAVEVEPGVWVCDDSDCLRKYFGVSVKEVA